MSLKIVREAGAGEAWTLEGGYLLLEKGLPTSQHPTTWCCLLDKAWVRCPRALTQGVSLFLSYVCNFQPLNTNILMIVYIYWYYNKDSKWLCIAQCFRVCKCFYICCPDVSWASFLAFQRSKCSFLGSLPTSWSPGRYMQCWETSTCTSRGTILPSLTQAPTWT